MICFGNIQIYSVLVFILFLVFILYIFRQQKSTNIHQKISVESIDKNPYFPSFNLPYFNLPYFNYPIRRDVLLDPYIPPLKDERYSGIRLNASTINTNYRQVGILTPLNGSENKILPLMGRPLNLGRNTWQYYTISNQHNNVKLQIVKNKKKCNNEYGCNEILEKERVFVQGYNQPFLTTIYENEDSFPYFI
jgi:hypothetical protein